MPPTNLLQEQCIAQRVQPLQLFLVQLQAEPLDCVSTQSQILLVNSLRVTHIGSRVPTPPLTGCASQLLHAGQLCTCAAVGSLLLWPQPERAVSSETFTAPLLSA